MIQEEARNLLLFSERKQLEYCERTKQEQNAKTTKNKRDKAKSPGLSGPIGIITFIVALELMFSSD